MKRGDIVCIFCDQGLLHNKDVVFYRVRVEQMVFDLRAIQRRHGLEEYFGGGVQGAGLAEVMGADEDLARRLSGAEVLVCGSCARQIVDEAAFNRRSGTEGGIT